MKTSIIITAFMCSLLTSCSSNKACKSSPPEVHPISEEILQKGTKPIFDVFPLIYGYYERENKYPESPEVLIEYYKNITSNTVLNLDDYNVLEFNLTQTNIMEIVWEQSSEPFFQGSLIVTPESFIDPINGVTKKEK